MALTGSVSLDLVLKLTKALDLSTPDDTVTIDKLITLGTDVPLAAVDLLWHDQRTLAVAATEDIILDATFTDAFGTSMAASNVNLIYISNTSTADYLEVGGAAATQLLIFDDVSDIIHVQPSGIFLWTGDLAVTGANDTLKILNDAGAAGAVTYDIVIAATA